MVMNLSVVQKKHVAFLLKKPGTLNALVPEEVATPIPSGESVLLKVLSVGICHSDLHRWKGELPCPEGRRAGAGTHEVVGSIVAKGERVPDNVKEGQKVLLDPVGVYVEEDKYIRKGLTHHSKKNLHFGGGMQEFVLVPSYRGFVSLEGLDDVHAAAPLGCAARTTYGAVKKTISYVEPDDYVAVIGLGGLGCYAAQWVKLFMPHANLIGIDVRDDALDFASKLAKIDMVINAAKEDPIKTINEVTKGDGAKAVIDLVANAKTIPVYVKTISHLGIYVLVGVAGREVLLPEIPALITKEATIQGSFMGSLTELYEVATLARKKLLNYRDVITKRLKFDVNEVNEAFKDLDEGKVLGRQIVVLE